MSWSDPDIRSGQSRLMYEAMICRQCEAAAASAFLVPLARIRSANRHHADVALARAGAIHLASACFGLQSSATGRAFGRHRSTITHACRRVRALCQNEAGFSLAMACLADALRQRVCAIADEASWNHAAGADK